MISQTDDPFRRIIPRDSSINTNYPDSSSGRMIRLFACMYTQTNYQTNYRSLPKSRPRRMIGLWYESGHCCGHSVAHDVSSAAQTGKHLLRTQNVSEQNQKQFLFPGHKICVRNKCTRGQTGKHLCRQQCVRNNVSSFRSSFVRPI